MKPSRIDLRAALIAGILALTQTSAADPEPRSASSIPQADLIEPAEFARSLQTSARPKPLILQVGFRTLYVQAHIPNSEYVGPTNQDSGLNALRKRVAPVPKDSLVVIYCGCCPWSRCPNVAAAYDAVHALGFTHVKVLHIADDFGSNWVDKGYPVVSGE
jgi:thiosulfate/3-mercaptopyruvate sulfurtransferase